MSALIYCPFPDRDTAEKVGERLIDEGLIACINIGSAIHSLYVWQGKRGSGEEIPALLKTDENRLDSAIERLEHLHPYDTPAILGWPCRASAGTRAWLEGLDEGDKG